MSRSMDQATDCELGPTDWATIGARILQAAALASAVHLSEGARRSGEGPDLSHGGVHGRTPVVHKAMPIVERG